MKKFLIIRFSSLGDIVHCLEVPSAIKEIEPQSEIHWVVLNEFSEIVKLNPHIDRVWEMDRQHSFSGFKKLANELCRENYTHIYDAHSNLRSHVLLFLMRRFSFIRRSKERLKRFLLFKLRLNLLPKPYLSANSFLKPLKPWGVRSQVSPLLNQPAFPKDRQSELQFSDLESAIVLAPSGNWDLKRWPIEYWQKLIELLPDKRFVILGGPDDQFCETIRQADPSRVINLAGKINWLQTAAIIYNGGLTISGDTGTLHLADYFNKKTLALIGPTAFGYPSRENPKVLEVDLPCRPCTKDGRGKCKQSVYKKCLMDLTPEQVVGATHSLLGAP